VDGCGKSRPHRDSIPDLTARSKSLYRLRYPVPSALRTHEYLSPLFKIYSLGQPGARDLCTPASVLFIQALEGGGQLQGPIRLFLIKEVSVPTVYVAT
jgi:hypothetical protein